ncbi:MAG: inorganic phosphate transporter [Chloroflexi bacterium]|nr:inorganic phosphate transporter [Chloroflexota bacterium]
MSISFFVILALAVAYGYLNGVHGAASVVSTMISSRALHPRLALILAATSITIGPFVLGTAVVHTVAVEFVRPEAASVRVIVAALISAVIWSSLTLWLRIPSSISQALFGGLIGGSWAGFGLSSIQTAGLVKVMVALFVSPVLGLIAALLLVRLVYFLGQWASPRINRWFNRGQIVAAVLMAISFGANDGQKLIAVIALGLSATGITHTFTIPGWVTILSATTIGLGTLTGGMRLIKTLGVRFYKIRPIHGFGAQMASAGIILGAGLLGGPVSGSQVVTSSILGAGSADRIQKVRWGVAQQILVSWLLTLPLSTLFAMIAYRVLEILSL